MVNGDVTLRYFTVEYATAGLRLEDGTTRFQTYLVEHGTLRYCSTGFRQTTGGDLTEQASTENNDFALVALQMTIDELLAPLPATYREIIRLRIDRHEIADIAVQTSRSKRSVERILHEFQRKLHGLIDAN